MAHLTLTIYTYHPVGDIMKSIYIKITFIVIIAVLLLTGLRVIIIFKDQNTAIYHYQSLYHHTEKALNEKESELAQFKLSAQNEQERLKKEINALKHLVDIERKSKENKNAKTIYLTFDDGPSSKITLELLDILDLYHVKATFFVTGYQVKHYPNILKEIHRRGHAIGNHSASHNYYTLYKDFDSFKSDFEKNQTLIKEVIGVEPTLYRFPGGALTAYNIAGQDLKNEFEMYLIDRGVQYFDWNVDSRDASSPTLTSATIQSNLERQIANKKEAIVLLHDTNAKVTTPSAVKAFIELYLNKGYQFDKLSTTGFTVHQKSK